VADNSSNCWGLGQEDPGLGKDRKAQLTVALALALLALIPTTVFAASVHETIKGAETGYPTPCGTGPNDSQSSFAGEATGGINGAWSATICHTAVSPQARATILGGYFRVRGLTTNWRYVTSYDTFSGGSIVPAGETNSSGRCTQTFLLQKVTLNKGSSFDGTLVHYGLFTNGGCQIFSATIVGSGTLVY
jgi:hypothetical protein